MSWRVVYTTHPRRDAKKLNKSGLKSKAEELLDLLAVDPYQTPPDCESASNFDPVDYEDINHLARRSACIAWADSQLTDWRTRFARTRQCQ